MHFLQSLYDILLKLPKWLSTAVVNAQSLNVWARTSNKLLDIRLSLPENLVNILFVEQYFLSVVWAAVACKVEMQKYLLGELVGLTSSNEVFLHILCLYVSHEDQLLLAIERHL